MTTAAVDTATVRQHVRDLCTALGYPNGTGVLALTATLDDITLTVYKVDDQGKCYLEALDHGHWVTATTTHLAWGSGYRTRTATEQVRVRCPMTD